MILLLSIREVREISFTSSQCYTNKKWKYCFLFHYLKDLFWSHESLYKQSRAAIRDQQRPRLSRSSFLSVRTNFAQSETRKNPFIHTILFYSYYGSKIEKRGKERKLPLLENSPKRFLDREIMGFPQSEKGRKNGLCLDTLSRWSMLPQSERGETHSPSFHGVVFWSDRLRSEPTGRGLEDFPGQAAIYWEAAPVLARWPMSVRKVRALQLSFFQECSRFVYLISGASACVAASQTSATCWLC